MALVSCRECERSISEEIASCPHCGFPTKDSSEEKPSAQTEIASQIPVVGSPEPRKENSGCGCFRYGCLTWLIILLVLWLTCPGKEDHAEKMNEAFVEYLGTRSLDNKAEAVAYGLAPLLGNLAIDRISSVDSYGIFSLGRITFGGKSKVVTFGILGQVFYLGSTDSFENSQQAGTADMESDSTALDSR